MKIPAHIRKKQGGWWEAVAALAAAAVSAYSQNRTNKKNQQEAEKQREFGAGQTATSYQRGVLDMQAAGLNPMLAYSQGGAQSAGSSQAVMQPEITAQGLGNSAQSVMGMLTGMQQIKNGEVSAEQTLAQTEKIKSETLTNQLNTAKTAAEVENTKSNTRNLDTVAQRTMEEVLQTRYSALDAAMRYKANKRDGDDTRGTGWEADVRKRRAEATLSEMDIPRAKNEAAWEQKMETLNPALKTILNVLRGVSSARSSMK